MSGMSTNFQQTNRTSRHARQTRPTAHSRRRLRSMQLERLEARQLLATFTWDGGGGDNLWTTPANWVGDAAPGGSNTDDLVFTGSARTANTNNFPAGTTFNSIAFNSSAGNFTIGGNAIKLNGGVDIDVAAGAQTLNLPMTIDAATTINVASGSLRLGARLDGSQSLTKTGTGALTFAGLVSLPTVNAAGGDVTFSPASSSSGFNISLESSGPTGTVVPTTNGVLPNLSLQSGATAFAASTICCYSAHTIPHLNDGLYGNSNSWIDGGTPLSGIDLPGTGVYSVSSLVFGRANDQSYADRSNGTYTVYRTLVPDPNSSLLITGDAASGWESMGTIVVTDNPIRKVYAMDQGGQPVAMTGLMLNSPGGAAIDEIEIYGAPFAPGPAPTVPDVNVSASGTLIIPSSDAVGTVSVTGAGTVINLAGPPASSQSGALYSVINTSTGPTGNPVPTSNGAQDNLAIASFGSTPFASETIVGYAAHTTAHLNDGLYGNGNSWIGSFGNLTTAGIDLQGSQVYNVTSVSISRANIVGDYTDRSDGNYTFYHTLVPNPDNSLPITGNPDTGWVSMGVINVAGVSIKKTYAVSLDGQPVPMTGFMVSVPAGNCIDEFEIYGDAVRPSAIDLPTTTLNVTASSTVNLGLTGGNPALGAINISGAGTVLKLEGPPAALAPIDITHESSGPTGTTVPTSEGGLNNIALASAGATPFASSVIPGYAPTHSIPGLNNGLYGNSNSWIGSFSTRTFAGIDLPGTGAFDVSSIAFGRGNDLSYGDRSNGDYFFYRTVVADPTAALPITGDPNTGWEAVGKVTVVNDAIRKTYSVTQDGAPLAMTGFMIDVPTNGCIDEIEIYGAPGATVPVVIPTDPSPINLPDTPVTVYDSSTLNLGLPADDHQFGQLTLTGAAGGGTNFTLQNAATVAFNGVAAVGATGTSASLAGVPILNNEANGTIDVASGVVLAINSVISGATPLTKTGDGTLLLNAANTFTGPTVVSAGTLGGNGSVPGALNVASGATLSPGVTTGIFTSGDLTFASGSTFAVQVNSMTPGTGHDQQIVQGSVNINGAALSLTVDSNANLSQPIIIIANDGTDPTVGAFAGLPDGASLMVNGKYFYITYNDPTDRFHTGNDVALVPNNDVEAVDDDFGAVLLNTSYADTVLTNDSDPDGDALVSIVTPPAHGTVDLLDPATGEFIYTPDPNYIGPDSFVYQLSDGQFSDTATVSFTVDRFVVQDGTLYVAGTNRSDRIIVQSHSQGGVGIRFNNATYGPFDAYHTVVFGNEGSDTITVSGRPGVVSFFGGDGNDYLAGGIEDDLLDGGSGNDRILGGNGNDMLYGGPGSDRISGGNGDDTAYGDSYHEIYDTISGGDLSSLIGEPLEADPSEAGRDTINGDGGNDFLYGEGNRDSLNGGTGNDFLRGGDDSDRIRGGSGDDLLSGDAGSDALYGDAGEDVLLGGTGADQLYGGSGDDLLYAGTLMDDSDDALLAIAEPWFNFDIDAAFDELTANADDDFASDLLHGERGDDYYFLWLRDTIRISSEKRSPNVIVDLNEWNGM